MNTSFIYGMAKTTFGSLSLIRKAWSLYPVRVPPRPMRSVACLRTCRWVYSWAIRRHGWQRFHRDHGARDISEFMGDVMRSPMGALTLPIQFMVDGPMSIDQLAYFLLSMVRFHSLVTPLAIDAHRSWALGRHDNGW